MYPLAEFIFHLIWVYILISGLELLLHLLFMRINREQGVAWHRFRGFALGTFGWKGDETLRTAPVQLWENIKLVETLLKPETPENKRQQEVFNLKTDIQSGMVKLRSPFSLENSELFNLCRRRVNLNDDDDTYFPTAWQNLVHVCYDVFYRQLPFKAKTPRSCLRYKSIELEAAKGCYSLPSKRTDDPSDDSAFLVSNNDVLEAQQRWDEQCSLFQDILDSTKPGCFDNRFNTRWFRVWGVLWFIFRSVSAQNLLAFT